MENSPPSIFSKHLRTSRSHPLAPTFPIKRFFARAADAKTPATPAEFPSLTMRILPADGIFEIFMLHPTQPALRAVCDNGFRFSISLQRGGSPHNAPNADFRTRGRRDSAPPTPRSIREFSGKSFCSARRRRVRGNSGSLDAARFPRRLTPGCGSCSQAS